MGVRIHPWHLEYALPAWANIADKDVDKMKAVQIQCLRRITGIKAHSAFSAAEVVSGILPVRLCKRELCCREYVRILTQNEDHALIQMLATST